MKALEIVKHNQLKFGNQYWREFLRKPEINYEKIEDDFFNSKNQKYAPTVEIIRKPQSARFRSTKVNESPFTSFDSNFYFNEKIEDYKKGLVKIKNLEEKEFDKLEIIDENKLKKEK